jgi:hypothetical protein
MQFDSGEMRTSEGIEWKIAKMGARNLSNEQGTMMGRLDLRYQFI